MESDPDKLNVWKCGESDNGEHPCTQTEVDSRAGDPVWRVCYGEDCCSDQVTITRVVPNDVTTCRQCIVTLFADKSCHDIDWFISDPVGIIQQTIVSSDGKSFVLIPNNDENSPTFERGPSDPMLSEVMVTVRSSSDHNLYDERMIRIYRHNPDENVRADQLGRTPAQLAFCDQYPLPCLQFLDKGTQALWRNRSNFCTVVGDCCNDGRIGNAFQHAWAACEMAQTGMGWLALEFLDSHEDSYENPCVSAAMDHHNNRIGFSLGRTFPSSDCFSLTLQALNSGQLRWLNPEEPLDPWPTCVTYRSDITESICNIPNP